MKNKKIVSIFIILFIVIFIAGYFLINHFKKEQEETTIQEYTPEEEITEEQFRQTIVSLYFPNKETGKLIPEARLVDIREVMNTPYETLIGLLIEGPKNEKLEKIMPNATKVLRTFKEGDCITVDFSGEFLNYDKEKKENLIKSITNTLTELTEVNKIKILINGQTNEDFLEEYVRESQN